MRTSAFLLALLIPATAGAQYYQTDFPAEEFKARQANVFEGIGDNAVAVVQGVPQTEGFTRRAFRPPDLSIVLYRASNPPQGYHDARETLMSSRA